LGIVFSFFGVRMSLANPSPRQQAETTGGGEKKKELGAMKVFVMQATHPPNKQWL
jgi:hypothetical protein